MNFEITEGVVNGAQKVVLEKQNLHQNFLIQYLLILKVPQKNTM